jgi:HEAT repeat protein
VELGERPPLEVSNYLVSMSYFGASNDAAEEGLFLSRLPRGADPTAGILRVARDRELPSEVRRSGLFWAGQMATEVVVEPLRAVAVEDDAEQQVRDAAVFALSQHRGEAAVPVLMELALEAPHPGTRRSAMFWLAQRDDPEIADFLADVILGRRGG